MATRGQKSSAELSIVQPDTATVIDLPPPPVDLSDEQADEWRAVVSRMPADWFPRETHAMLAAYCRHVVSAKRVASLIARVEKDENLDIADYDRLLKCQERESRCLASLAVRMRLAQSTAYDKTKKRGSQIKKPWED